MRTLALLAALFLALGGPSAAQDPVQSPILTIDLDRLFEETRLGARASSLVEAEAAALTTENRQIEAELVEEESALTEQRATLPPEEFRALADAFDAKVQRIRAEQDAKARELAQLREAARQGFLGEIGGILTDIVNERGAVVVLERRDIFISADRIDVTDEAIGRINQALGEGAPPIPATEGD